MNFQLVIVIIIVATALGIGIYRTARSLRNPLRKCDGCNMACGGCSLEELKKQVRH